MYFKYYFISLKLHTKIYSVAFTLFPEIYVNAIILIDENIFLLFDCCFTPIFYIFKAIVNY